MNLFKLFYVCMKPVKVPVHDTKVHDHDPNPIKCDASIENINVCITNERLTEGSLNYSESCNSIISELSTIDEE